MPNGSINHDIDYVILRMRGPTQATDSVFRPCRQFGSATQVFFEPWRLAILLRFVTRISPLVAFSARVSEL